MLKNEITYVKKKFFCLFILMITYCNSVIPDETPERLQFLRTENQPILRLNNTENQNNLIYTLDKKQISITKRDFLKNKIMAHRGLFGYLPEHSIRGFELAYFMGTDFLETDINITNDGKLVVFHDPILDTVTNVDDFPEYSNRRRNKTIDGIHYKNSYFITDFTYDEISRLNIKQRYSYRPQMYNEEFRILLIEDLINYTINLNKIHNKITGIYIEPKNPIFYKEELNLDISEQLFNILNKYKLIDFNDKTNFYKCPIVIQAFELDTLKYFKKNTNLPQIYLMSWRFFYNIKESPEFADGLGPDINYILYERVDDLLTANKTIYENHHIFIENVVRKTFFDDIEKLGKIILPQQTNLFLEYAKKLELVVHPYNMNNDNPKFSINPEIQYCKMTKLGVDGFFADFCDTALLSIKNYDKLCIDF